MRSTSKAQKPKLAPDLEELLKQDDADEAARRQDQMSADVRPEGSTPLEHPLTERPKENEDESEVETPPRIINGTQLPSAEVSAEEKQSFIVPVERGTPQVLVEEKLALLGGRIKQQYQGQGLLTMEAPRTAIRQLAAQSSIAYFSPDRPVAASGHLEATTGAALARTLAGDLTLNGAGIGIAVLDSGVDTNHFLVKQDHEHPSVVTYKNFSGSGDPDKDRYGHGTHVAALVNGSIRFQAGAYAGVAPAAKLINVKVLNDNGVGAASNLIAAIDWVIANQHANNGRPSAADQNAFRTRVKRRCNQFAHATRRR
jgi:subtilisin family serine protease